MAKVEALYNKERLISKQNQQMHTARSRQDFLLICFLCACLAIGIVYVIMFQIISKHKLRNKEIQKLLQKNESLLLSDKQEMEKKRHRFADYPEAIGREPSVNRLLD
ncbi:MAG: hypothetical protein V8T16_03205 [Parabacteroides merdae]